MSGADVHTGAAAYALGALPDDERQVFELHLETCEECRQEVDGFRATAALLGRAVAVPPPAHVRETTLRRVAATPQEGAPPSSGRPERRTRGWTRLALAACLALAAVLGGTAAWQHQEAEEARTAVRQAQQREAAVADVLASSDVRLRSERAGDGAVLTVAVSRDRDAAAIIASGLPRLPSGKVYEAWFMRAGNAVPAGLLGSGARERMTLLDGPVDEATAVAVTVEPAGGSAQPTTSPLASISLSA